MRADPDHDQPFRLFDPFGILLRVAQARGIDLLCHLDLLRRAVVDEDRLAAPDDGQPLSGLDRGQIDLGGGQCQGVAGRVQTVDKRPDADRRADAANCRSRQDQKIAPRFALMARHNLRLRQIGHWGTSSIKCCLARR